MRQVIVFLFMAILTFSACHDVTVGYLRTTNACFYPDTLEVRTALGPADANRKENNAPWVSNIISGVLGTEPMQYEFVSVKASEGGDADLFAKEIVVGGCGKMQIPLVPQSPKGRYLVTLKVKNEGYSAILSDVFTFIIK